jgi:phosphatidate cytidylyltransferase
MSPSAALHDPVFRAYVGVVFGVLLGAGIVLALLQIVFRIKLGGVWKTYRSWLWMAPLAALVIFAGRVPFIIGVTTLGVLAFGEFARVSALDRDWWTIGAVSAGIVAVGIASLLAQRDGFVSVPIFAVAFILLLPILRNRVHGEVQRMSLGIVAFICLGWLFGHLAFLANAAHAYGYLCYVILGTEVNDVAAFTCGKMFGRHPLRSEISPRKTWEGALGALAASLALPWLLRFSFPFFGTWQLVLAGLIVGIGGQLGDLSFSAIKRDLGAKDWGASIPGHGGILDRIDSLIFVAPLFMLMAGYYYPWP